MTHSQKLMITVAASVCLLGAACSKKVAIKTPPPPAAPVAVSVAKPAPRLAPAPAQAAVVPLPATPAPHYPNAATRARIDELLAKIEDAYFDYDTATIRADALKALEADSTELRIILAQYPDYKLTIEGHCDERGSAEYNLGLGDRRAAVAKAYLVQVGIPAGQLSVMSYGKERPVCAEHDEACWQKNRRVHIVAMATQPQP
jgi:peptidoglycan-associated lipoprotein